MDMTHQSVLLIISFLFILLSCSKEEKREVSKKERIFHVRTLQVEVKELYTQYRTSGYFEAVHRVALRPEVSGRVKELFVEEGDYIRKGQPVLKIDDSLYRKAYEEAFWNLERARRELRNLKSIYERRKKLFQKELISKEEFEEAKTRFEEAKARLESLSASFERRKLELSKTLLRSPTDAFVLKRNVNLGEYVTPQKVVYELVRTKPLRFVFKVPQEMVGFLEPGKEVSIESGNVKLKAKVSYISPSADERKLFTVKVRVDNPNGLRPGVYGDVAFNYKKVKGVLIPEEALQLSQRQSFVWVMRNSRALKLPVEVVAHREGKVAVHGPFKEKDRIVVEGFMFLYEGAKVIEE